MQTGIHPPYDLVAFRDRSTGDVVVTRSTVAARTTETLEVHGTTYPLVDVDVTTHSHPYWTGKGRVLDSEGRVEAFERRYGARRSRS